MIPGHGPVVQSVLGTFLTWGLTAAGSALVFVFSSGQVGAGTVSFTPGRETGSETEGCAVLVGGFGCLIPSVRDLMLALGGPGTGGGKIQLISPLRVNTEEKEIKFLTPGCGMCCSAAHGIWEMGQSRRQGSAFGTAGSPPVTWFCCHVSSVGFGSGRAQNKQSADL